MPSHTQTHSTHWRCQDHCTSPHSDIIYSLALSEPLSQPTLRRNLLTGAVRTIVPAHTQTQSTHWRCQEHGPSPHLDAIYSLTLSRPLSQLILTIYSLALSGPLSQPTLRRILSIGAVRTIVPAHTQTQSTHWRCLDHCPSPYTDAIYSLALSRPLSQPTLKHNLLTGSAISALTLTSFFFFFFLSFSS